MELISLWALQIMMFLLMAAGAVMAKTGILKPEGKGILTDAVLYFFLPCNIVNSFRMEFSMEILKKFALCLVIASLIQVICYLLSRVLYNHKSKEIRQVMQYCTLVSNSGFLGMPIAEGIFGAEGLMYAAVFIVPTRIVMWTAGVSCFTQSPDMRSVLKRLMLHPCIIAVEAGLALLVFQAPLASLYEKIINGGIAPVSALASVLLVATDKAVRSAGGCTTALTMVLIGMMMADVRGKDMLDRNVALITGLRLALLPAIVWAGCRLAQIDPLITGIAVVITGMPAGSTSAILAAKHGCDYKFATRCIVVSTFLSLFSVPLWRMIL